MKALIIAMTKKSQYCPGEQQEKTIKIRLKNLSKLNEIIKDHRRSILKHKDHCSDETCSGILLYILVHRRKLSGF